MPCKKVFIVGQCGDGKSTLVNSLVGKSLCPTAATTGKNARGITKEVVLHPSKKIGNVGTVIVFTPGVGDSDVSPMDLLAKLEKVLAGQEKKVYCLAVTQGADASRINLGLTVARILVDNGFLPGEGNSKFANVILC